MKPQKRLKTDDDAISSALRNIPDGNHSDISLIALTCISGAKISWALKVKPSDIDFVNRVITVDRGRHCRPAEIQLPDWAVDLLTPICEWKKSNGDDSSLISYSYPTARRRLENLKEK